ncbi:MAG: hypothetical protein JKY56_12985 [Kofleriaceae bacterium]|nr:hypothetical protein [Kofleriaceae bacterium]
MLNEFNTSFLTLAAQVSTENISRKPDRRGWQIVAMVGILLLSAEISCALDKKLASIESSHSENHVVLETGPLRIELDKSSMQNGILPIAALVLALSTTGCSRKDTSNNGNEPALPKQEKATEPKVEDTKTEKTATAPGELTLEAMQGIVDEMCACTDKACLRRVEDKAANAYPQGPFEKLIRERPKVDEPSVIIGRSSKATIQVDDEAGEIMKKATECALKLDLAADKAAQMHYQLCDQPAPDRFPPEFKRLVRAAKEKPWTRNSSRSVFIERPVGWAGKVDGLAAKLRSSGWTVWVAKDTGKDPTSDILAAKDGQLAAVSEHRHNTAPHLSVEVMTPLFDAKKYLATVEAAELTSLSMTWRSLVLHVRGDQMATLRAKLEAGGAALISGNPALDTTLHFVTDDLLDTTLHFVTDDLVDIWLSVSTRGGDSEFKDDKTTQFVVGRDCPWARN